MKERKKKAMLILPLIVAPFVVFIFWIVGLVGPAEVMASGVDARGINLNLPAAVPSADSSWDKLHFYEAADKDSAKLKQLRRQDPYLNENKFAHDPLARYGAKAKYQPYPDEALNEADEQEKKVYEKISAIHREIDREPVKKKEVRENNRVELNKNNDVDRLERMMEMMNSHEPEKDPEMVEIQQLMEGIKDIQYPERVSERLKQNEVKEKVLEVKLSRDEIIPSEVQMNRFYSMEDGNIAENAHGVFAVVHETQKIATGDLVKMRLSQNIFINNQELPANSFVYGAAKIYAGRINVHVAFVQVNGEHFPVSMDVIGHDGMPGIPVVASKASMAAAQTADRATQGINMTAVDNLGAQVAGAAIQTGKQLFKKQTKVVQYQVPGGYQVQLVSSIN
jgi:conjugative transposon TraM protein